MGDAKYMLKPLRYPSIYVLPISEYDRSFGTCLVTLFADSTARYVVVYVKRDD